MSKYKSKTLNFLRQELKSLEQTIKTEKPAYRNAQSVSDKSYFNDKKFNSEANKAANTHRSNLWSAQSEFRTKHLIFGLLRGKTIDQMESNNPKRHPAKVASTGGKFYCYCCNHPDYTTINRLLPQYQKEFDSEKEAAEKAYLERKGAADAK